ncbi:uncharacterized protein BHQ10_003272 [Talaromyces amestolkiae]|uniref:Extracellular protein n=1 Tax=Talaromyces amestolkiae TaxID=1196081 RepID=A0A364KUM6_TALAM|nr:uncharacterized protein BHQ10_003272 [Talaromyces amestolkiae]RAO67260.1 hypothetical protein BHQ10_003272 [Talaromyces amestolkiae]
MKSTFAICAFLAATVSAHMQMSNPYPIRSPLNPNGDESKKDYSYTSPLDASGSNFPCKGYQTDAFVSVATYKPGSQYDLSLTGSATHGGGSCQISLSYDTGKTFTVIQSMEGGCPLTSNYTFTVPSDAPSGQALLAWTWFNKIGNREMYMNCAQVTIGGSSSKRSHVRDMMVSRADTAFSARPPIFIANVKGPGGCTTIESLEVNFPEAGPNVVGGVTGTGYTCTGSADFLGDGSSSSSSTSGSSGSSGSSGTSGSGTSIPAAAATSATSTTAPAVATVGASSASAPATTLVTSTSAPATNTILPSASSTAPKVVSSGTATSGEACSSNGAIVCGADGTTWSMCNQGALTYMGSVAAGTTCSNGSISKK